jgi:hypothetical protein
MTVLVPLLTALVSGAFALVVLRQYGRRRATYRLMWGTGLGMFAVAAFAGFLARTGGTTATAYSLFYLFGAILNVAWLGLGTAYLLARRAWATYGFGLVLALSLVATYAVLTTPIDLAAAQASGRGFPDGSLPRILAAVGSGVGSVVLIGGALWSAWGFVQRRRNGRRALGNALIAAGVLVVALGGVATFTGASGILELTNLAGVVVMFAGFLLIG